MDLSNTAIRWIKLDASPAKSSESLPATLAGKAIKPAFSDSLKTIHQGQGIAHNGNSLPNDEQPSTIEIRLLATDVNSTLARSSKDSGSQSVLQSSKPQSGDSANTQAELIHEISAFNREAQVDSDTTVSNKGAVSTDRLEHPSTIALDSIQQATQLGLNEASQPDTGDKAVTSTEVARPQLSDSSSPKQSDQTRPSSEIIQSQVTTPTTPTVDSKLNGAIQVQSRQHTLNADSAVLNLATPANTASPSQATSSLNAQIQLVANQPVGKQSLEARKSIKADATAGQEFKLPEATGKHVAVKLVMIEASATLQQWQKLKQINSDTTESPAEATGSLLPSESRPLKSSFELQTARLVKTEQDAQALSQKFAEQLGQRLIQNVQKGHWRAELELHPKSLGRIDVQLDFVNGQLEGHFQTHNPATRELLQEGLPRLREWLQQAGTQVASLEVNNGNSGQGGEKPTPQMLLGKQNDAATDEPVAELTSQETSARALKQGFDLLV